MKRIYLEITNACNLNCSFCTNQKGQSFISIEDFNNYTNQIKEYCDYIYLHVLGEPLLHNHFNELLDILDKKDFKLQLVTNGLLLNKYPDLYKHKCLRKLSISLQAINNQKVDNSYFEIINQLIEMKKDFYLELRFYNLENLDNNLLNYFNLLKEKYIFNLNKKINSYQINDKTYIYLNDLFKWPNINDDFISDSGYCRGLIDQMAILVNGDVTSCCLDTMGINKLGNLKEQSLKDILNSPLYIDALEDMKKRRLSLPLCKKCSYHLRFDHNNN